MTSWFLISARYLSVRYLSRAPLINSLLGVHRYHFFFFFFTEPAEYECLHFSTHWHRYWVLNNEDITHYRITLIFFSTDVVLFEQHSSHFSRTSFTTAQTQIELTYPIHAFTTGIGVFLTTRCPHFTRSINEELRILKIHIRPPPTVVFLTLKVYQY